LNKSRVNPKKWKLLYSEVDILRSLNHPNIIKFENVVETKSDIYLIMELLHGGSLGSAIKTHPKITEEASRKVMFSLFSALCYLH